MSMFLTIDSLFLDLFFDQLEYVMKISTASNNQRTPRPGPEDPKGRPRHATLAQGAVLRARGFDEIAGSTVCHVKDLLIPLRNEASMAIGFQGWLDGLMTGRF